MVLLFEYSKREQTALFEVFEFVHIDCNCSASTLAFNVSRPWRFTCQTAVFYSSITHQMSNSLISGPPPQVFVLGLVALISLPSQKENCSSPIRDSSSPRLRFSESHHSFVIIITPIRKYTAHGRATKSLIPSVDGEDSRLPWKRNRSAFVWRCARVSGSEFRIPAKDCSTFSADQVRD